MQEGGGRRRRGGRRKEGGGRREEGGREGGASRLLKPAESLRARLGALLSAEEEEEELNIIYNEHPSLVSTLVKQAAPGEYTPPAAQRAVSVAINYNYGVLFPMISIR